jgi:DNA-binding winged helix-turn-helix (wHTH) protein
VRIGRAVFDSRTGEVWQPGGHLIRLEPQPAIVLTLLAAHRGELVTHDVLRKSLWGDSVHVNFQQNLHYAVRQIRRALGESDRSAPVIETIPRRGYRLLAPVELAAIPARLEHTPDGPRQRGWPLWAAVAAAALVAVSILEQRPNDHHRIAVAILQTVHDVVY